MDNYRNGQKWIPYVTLAMIGINLLVFLFMEILGDTESSSFMIAHGAMYPACITEQKEYWRFLTAIFLHFGPKHLLNNMVLLGAAGNILERATGRKKFLLLYLVSGVGGTILSFLQMIVSGDYAVSAGASGAIFGLIGGLLWVVIAHHGRYESLTGKGMVFMIVLALYYGISAGGVDNWGHVGGLITGFLICIVLYRKHNPEWV